MGFVSFEFLGFILAGLFLFHATPVLALKRILLLVLNALFIASFASGEYQRLSPLILFLALGFAGIHLAHRQVPSLIFVLAIAFIVFVFAYVKRYALMEFLVFPDAIFMVVGLSYVFFRVLHLMIDVYGAALPNPPSLSAYLRYTCFFLSWVSGPIQRFEDYEAQESTIQSNPITWRVVHESISRTASGYFKVGVLSAIFISGHDLFVVLIEDVDVYLRLRAYAGAYVCYALYLYYNFAGYMDIVIGLGRLFGFTLPENFNKPFAAKNFLDFWSRWHMTLSEWFKFYMFNPLTKAMTYRFGTPRTIPYLGCIAYFITFLIMGVWHGTTPAYVVFGLFLGFGVSLNKLYQVILRKRLGKKRFARLGDNPLYGGVCRGLTFSYFAISLTCLWRTSDEMLRLAISLGPLNVFRCFFLVALIAAATAAAASGLGRIYGTFSRPLLTYLDNAVVRQVYLGVKVYVVFMLVVANASAVPEFVYEGF